MIDNINLHFSLESLSSITNDNYPVELWSAAVIILMVEDSLVFIKRSDTMPSHPGQISFVGGHKLLSEIDPVDTAKRELFEETSIPADNFDFFGMIHPVKTARNKLIIPVAAKYKHSKKQFLDEVTSNGEWNNLVLAPVSLVKNIALWQRAEILNSSHEKITDIFYFPLLANKCFYLNEAQTYVLWGASAKMVLNFFQNQIVDDKD